MNKYSWSWWQCQQVCRNVVVNTVSNTLNLQLRLKAATHKADGLPLANVGPLASICCPRFCGVSQITGTTWAPGGSFSTNSACWNADGLVRWERPLWLAVQLRESAQQHKNQRLRRQCHLQLVLSDISTEHTCSLAVSCSLCCVFKSRRSQCKVKQHSIAARSARSNEPT